MARYASNIARGDGVVLDGINGGSDCVAGVLPWNGTSVGWMPIKLLSSMQPT